MTQSVTNNLNNLEQMLSAQTKTQKVTEDVASGMDKIKDFTKVFESTLNKEPSSIKDVKLKISEENVDIKNNTIASAEFKEILEKTTEEANVETSLDLTLARDINEIISQLKEAVENATEIIEEDSEEGFIAVEDGVVLEEELDLEVDEEQDSLSQVAIKQEQKVSFEQILNIVDESLSVYKNTKNIQVEEDTLSNVQQMLETTAEEVVEFAENITDEVIASKTTEENNNNSDLELSLDEEVLKELKIESISADTDSSTGNDLMQNQTPEEYAVKAMINQEIELFEIKVDHTSNAQNAQQAPVKPTEINPSRILDQITKHLDGLQNNSKVNIVLNPESLGKVNIQLLSSKEGLTAQFTVTTQEAKDLLTKGLDGLKEALGAQGVAVDNVSVKVADSQKAEYHQDWTDQEGSRGGNKGQGQPNREEKEKGLFEKMMAQATEDENGNV